MHVAVWHMLQQAPKSWSSRNIPTYRWLSARLKYLQCVSNGDIKNNAWVTVNNDFLSRVRRFGNDFHEWRSHEWKIIAESPHEWQKIVIHGNECIILFLTRYFLSWTHKSAKNYHRALIFAIVAKGGLFWPRIVTSPQMICDVMRTRNTGIVTSYLSIVIARANWRKGDLH